MYGLSAEGFEIQARAGGFADELIPHEEYAGSDLSDLQATATRDGDDGGPA